MHESSEYNIQLIVNTNKCYNDHNIITKLLNLYQI